jgi:hypothetical protein
MIVQLRGKFIAYCPFILDISKIKGPRLTALLSPSSDDKTEAATAVVVAPDDGREDARNMLSCI